MKHKIPTVVWTHPDSAGSPLFDPATQLITTLDPSDRPISLAELEGRADAQALREWTGTLPKDE